MYRQMRRKDKAISEELAKSLLLKNEYGILSTVGEDGQPYATPLSYVFFDEHIYFHCATTGQKLDNISFEQRICFCIVGDTCPVYDNDFSTYYESVIVYGKALKVENQEEKHHVLLLLVDKYLPEHADKAPSNIENAIGHTTVIKISIDHITGKAKYKK